MTFQIDTRLLPRAVQYGKTEPYRTVPNRTEIDNMVWFWYIPYKPNGYNFIKTVGFGYGLVYNRLNRINRTKPTKSRNM